ncbi:MAG: mannitol dehydrogenase family protein [Bacillota bacterium]|nr:mannitol dehydrogenase family protein [Bacillota bacterium]
MTKLKVNNLSDPIWKQAGISLPEFNIAQIRKNTDENPSWIHFGGGNIFRVFIADLMQKLIDEGCADTGIIVAENYDPEIIEKIYLPNDNLTLAVSMGASGAMKKKVIASVTEALVSDCENTEDWKRIKSVFSNPSLQMCSFTITEKGYVLREFEGPEAPKNLMHQITALLYARYKSCGYPIAMVSLDNCSCNGKLLHDAIAAIARNWHARGYVPAGFVEYVADSSSVSFPWSMIDKITPRPSLEIRNMLEETGIEGMDIICTKRDTHIAPFVNTEKAEYLVIEDDFPAGRPALEKSGVIFADRETVQKTERMKVMTCLNPLHTALAVFGCLLGHRTIAEEMADEDLRTLVDRIGRVEGMPVVTDPGIIKPEDFLDEVLCERFPNPNIPDTPQRIATDTSQKIPIRFGETLKAYAASSTLQITDLKLIPLVIAAWMRYLIGIDDEGKKMALSSDPMLEELQQHLKGITFGEPESLGQHLVPILSSDKLFGIDLYRNGLGNDIESAVKEMLSGPGAVRRTLRNHLKEGETR